MSPQSAQVIRSVVTPVALGGMLPGGLWCDSLVQDFDARLIRRIQIAPVLLVCSPSDTDAQPFCPQHLLGHLHDPPLQVFCALSIRDSFRNCQFGNRECHSGTKLLNYVIRRVSVFISAFCETEEREKRHLPLITVVNHRPLIGVENPVKTTPS